MRIKLKLWLFIIKNHPFPLTHTKQNEIRVESYPRHLTVSNQMRRIVFLTIIFYTRPLLFDFIS
jgi:hypothetical protein